MAVQDGSPLILDKLREEIQSQRKGNATAQNRKIIEQNAFQKVLFKPKVTFRKVFFT